MRTPCTLQIPDRVKQVQTPAKSGSLSVLLNGEMSTPGITCVFPDRLQGVRACPLPAYAHWFHSPHLRGGRIALPTARPWRGKRARLRLGKTRAPAVSPASLLTPTVAQRRHVCARVRMRALSCRACAHCLAAHVRTRWHSCCRSRTSRTTLSIASRARSRRGSCRPGRILTVPAAARPDPTQTTSTKQTTTAELHSLARGRTTTCLL